MYGYLVENVGDINHDGYNDILLGYNGGLFSYVSYIYCYPGMDSLVDAAFSDDDFYAALYDGPVDHLGYDMSWCGDVNGDGIDDAIVTAETIAADVGMQGRVYIQSGWHLQSLCYECKRLECPPAYSRKGPDSCIYAQLVGGRKTNRLWTSWQGTVDGQHFSKRKEFQNTRQWP